MSAQLALDGLGHSSPTDRLFFAVFPDPDTAGRIGQLSRALRARHGLSGTPLRNDRLHITLHHLGDHAGLPADLIEAASRAAGRVDVAKFAVVFDRVESFARGRRHRPFVMRSGDGAHGLHGLHGELGRCLTAAGLGSHVEPRFTPHVTLLYDPQVVAAHAIDPVGWTAQDFVLVHSLLGKTEHRILGRWSLRQVDSA